MAAPKPVPTHMRLVKGNPSKRAINTKEPKPPVGKPKCPSHLDPKGKAAWKKLCEILDNMGVLTLADQFALEILCSVYARIRFLQERIKEKGGTSYETMNTQGEVMHRAFPEITQLEKAEHTFRSYITEFGLTPSSRSKVQVENKVTADPLEKYGV